MNEKWKDIKGYEGMYQVSNTGKIKSLKRTVKRSGHIYKVSEKIVNQGVNPGGYAIANLSKNGIQKVYTIHRIVMREFCGESKLKVNHKDGNKLNNNLDNLEYCTQKENMHHAIEKGLLPLQKGSINVHAKLNESQVLRIKKLLGLGWFSRKRIAKKFNVSEQMIYRIEKNKNWKHVKTSDY